MHRPEFHIFDLFRQQSCLIVKHHFLHLLTSEEKKRHGNKNRVFFYPAYPKSIIMKMFHRKQPVFKVEIQAILRQLHLQFPIGRIFIHPCVFFQLVGQLCVFHRRKRYLLIQIPQHLQCQLLHLYFLCFLSFRIRSSSLLLP